MHRRARLVDLDGVRLQFGQRQFAHQQSAVGVRCRAEPAGALGHAGQHLLGRAPLVVEQFPRVIGAQPRLQLPQVLGVVPDGGQRDLVGAPGALDREAVDLGGAGPALRSAQDDHRPVGALGHPVLAGAALDRVDALQGVVHGGGHGPVHGHGVVAGDVDRRVAVAAQQFVEFGLGEPGEEGRVGDLVAVEVQDRQDRSVVHGVEELVGVPGRGQRAGLRLAVPDHAGDEEVRVVEGGPVGVRQGVAQLAALVDRTGGLRGHMAGHTAGERELPEQPLHAVRVPADVGIGLRVGALQPGVGQYGRTAVARPPHAQGVPAAGPDDAVEMGVHEVQTRGGAPVAEQPRLDVLRAQRLGEQRVRQEVDLADGQVVGGAPVGVEGFQLVVGELGGCLLRVDGHRVPFRGGLRAGVRANPHSTTFLRRGRSPTGPFGPPGAAGGPYRVGTTTTGQWERCRRVWPTVPSRGSSACPCRWAPTTTRPACRVASSRACAGAVRTVRLSTPTPV
ncbi:hypothetical protein RKD46_008061 [Streptomyces pseudovenezuelae]